jgi:enoyl-CoA hydratase
MPEAIKLAERIASRAPLSVEAVKRSASLAPDLTPEEFAQVNNKEVAVLSHSADHHEALAAFAQKREPKFTRE